MRKSILAVSVASVFSLPGLATAQSAPAATPAYTFTGNMALVSDYRFRGISQTFGKPAIQGGFDFAHSATGIYLGNWNSNVSDTAGYPGGNIEMDFYGGWRKSWSDYGLDVGFIRYWYPGSNAAGGGSQGALANPHTTATNSGTVHNDEVYIAGSWKWLSLKWSHSISDYFLVPDTKGTDYIDLSANYDLGGGWGVNGHAGHLKVHHFGEASYTDYKLGVTKDLSGWTLGASLVATDAKDGSGGGCGNGLEPYYFCKPDGTGLANYAAGKSTIVLSVSKTF